MGALFSFLSGSVFRMLWGEIASFITKAQEGYSETHAAAYVKAEIRLCTPQTTVVQLKVWESQAKRTAGAPPLRYDSDLRQFPTNLQMQADNPIAYAYTLLEQSGEFPEATWNV